MEGFETQDVVAAIERHSVRYGVPGFLYIDNGTQLKALKHSSMSLRDVHAQVQDSLSNQIVVSTSKHTLRGEELRERLDHLGNLWRKLVLILIILKLSDAIF